ncbi:MAG TPA: tripartite tricarboxylate transporter TctB family protein [Burkholderiales bacterium]|nr:tripartite tricarboxylate transporter TctB family protein [Burkholderiales bacterium]
MRIKSPKDFWAGLMFIAFGLFFAVWALVNYQMGSAVRMGPAYFPTVLGGLLVFLGAIVLIESFAMQGGKLALPYNRFDFTIFVAILAVLGLATHFAGLPRDYAILAGTTIVAVLAIWFRPATKPLVLICAACVAYGYLMKPLGLVLSTAALVFIAAFGGHEFRWREVAILYVLLIVFSVLVFVKGLTLPFPLWPAALS